MCTFIILREPPRTLIGTTVDRIFLGKVFFARSHHGIDVVHLLSALIVADVQIKRIAQHAVRVDGARAVPLRLNILLVIVRIVCGAQVLLEVLNVVLRCVG